MTADLRFVGIAFGAYLISAVVVAWRWQVVIAALTGQKPPLLQLLLATFAAAFVGNITPANRLGGEACRVAFLARLGLASVPRATAIVACERLSELPSLLLIATVTLVVVGRLPVSASRVPLVWWLALATVVGLLVGWREPLARIARAVQGRIAALRTLSLPGTTLASAVALSAGVWLLDVVRLRLVLAAFGAPVSFAQTATLSAVTIMAGLIPTVGGLGPVEGGLVAALIALGLAPAEAVAITTAERSITYGLAMLVGAGSLAALGGKQLLDAVRAKQAQGRGE